MISAPWYSDAGAFLWQVVLHSFVTGGIFYVWLRRLRLRSGRGRRRLLIAALCLPLLTAAVPGRTGIDFRAGLAWMDSLLTATSGWPWRPRLVVSDGTLSRLTAAELEAVVRHENAHWRDGRWLLGRGPEGDDRLPGPTLALAVAVLALALPWIV